MFFCRSKVFRQFDEDGSGAISHEELFLALRYMGLKPSKRVVNKIVKSMDTDHSGTIDEEEFLEFFAMVDSMAEFKYEIASATKKGGIWSRIMQIYFLLIFVMFCVFVHMRIFQKIKIHY